MPSKLKLRLELISELIWPFVKSLTQQEITQNDLAIKDDNSAITKASWGKNPNLFLEELHRMYDEEQERRRAADTKASNYLLVAAALISILTYFGGLLGDELPSSKVAAIIGYFATTAIVFAVLYIMGFVWWSFKALKASSYETLGTVDLTKFTKSTSAQAKKNLIISLAKSIRSNQDQTNKKMTFVNLSHLFLFRIFIMFSIIAILQCLISIASKINADTNQPHENHTTAASYSVLKNLQEGELFEDSVTKVQLSFKYSLFNSLPIATINLGSPRKPIIAAINSGDSWNFLYRTDLYTLKIIRVDRPNNSVDIGIRQI
ncbi:MAG: hypothetical protein CTY33_02935 [Methylotenera sp.]|nr:MAG: hypothetical protein CTY33_02935 [Methylotenera sp.]